MIDHKTLIDALHYCQETGTFTWKSTKSRNTKIGSVAGALKNGYVRISIENKLYYAHRLAFLYVAGKFPDQQIDHIDGNRANNSFKNLRDVSSKVNNQNVRVARSNNASGLLGASWNKSSNKFESSVRIDGKKHHIGTFDDATEAHLAYVSKKRSVHAGCTI